MIAFAAGQRWVYKAPPEIAHSRIVIGAILDFGSGQRIACCSVTDALERRADGTVAQVTVAFLPMTIEALAATVQEPDGTGALPDDFADQLEAWQRDPRGVTYFTVPFEGALERMIALQMASIVDQSKVEE